MGTPMWLKSLQYRLDRLMAGRRGHGPVVHPRRSRKAVEATGRAWVAWADGTVSVYPRQPGEPLHYDRSTGHHIPESQVGRWMTDEIERDPEAMESLRRAREESRNGNRESWRDVDWENYVDEDGYA